MMKIIVVEPTANRRAELVDWTCELPGYVVVAAVPGYVEAVVQIARTQVDVIVLGEVPLWDLAALARLADRYSKELVEAGGSMADLAAVLAEYRARRKAAEVEASVRSASLRRLAYEGEVQHASAQTLQYRLRDEPRTEHAVTIDLREWIPRAIARLRTVVPPHIELVAMVAVDTAPVRCLPTALEHVVSDTVLRACEHLPWGGTVWLTAAPGADGEVVLDVLEDGRGEIRDVRLPASATTSS